MTANTDFSSPPTSLNLLGDQTAAGGCCGGGSCMCGTTASGQPQSVENHAPSTGAQEFLVTGMTCGHCVSSVKEEVGAIEGVESVEVVLKNGGESRVTVRATGALDPDAVRAAVEEAGYQLA